MPGITDYPLVPPRGWDGQLADEAPHYIRSAINKETVAIPFGKLMVKGAGEDQAVLIAAAADKPIGIGVHRHDVNTIGSSNWGADAGIPKNDRFDLLLDGVILVKVEEAVVQDDPAFARFAPNGAHTQHGGWRKSADPTGGAGTETAVAVKGAYFLESGAIGAIVPLYFSARAARS